MLFQVVDLRLHEHNAYCGNLDGAQTYFMNYVVASRYNKVPGSDSIDADCSAQVVFCNDTCQCIADVLVLGVVQTSVDCISLFEPSRMLES